ncbi:hypothetical protein ACJX0J_022011 [Zea mays]
MQHGIIFWKTQILTQPSKNCGHVQHIWMIAQVAQPIIMQIDKHERIAQDEKVIHGFLESLKDASKIQEQICLRVLKFSVSIPTLEIDLQLKLKTQKFVIIKLR